MWETERRMPVPCDRLLLTNPTKPSQRRQAPHTLASEVRERECSELNAERREPERKILLGQLSIQEHDGECTVHKGCVRAS